GSVEVGEGVQRFGEGDFAAPVQQVQIYLLHAEAAQAALAGGRCSAPGRVMRVDFGDQEDLVAATSNRFADQLLSRAFAVHLGGVDQGHTEVDAAPQGCELACTAAFVFAHFPCTQAEGGDCCAGG